MPRKMILVLLAVVIGAAVAASAGALLAGGGAAAAPEKKASRYALVAPSPEAQPDTTSPNWKQLSDDIGLLVRRDDRLGLRARFYVKVDGAWLPVATDTAGDIAGPIPAR